MNNNIQTALVVSCLSKGFGGMEKDAIKTAKLLSQQNKVWMIVKKGSYLEKLAARSNNENIKLYTVDFSSKAFSISLIVNLNRFFYENHDVKNFIFFGASELKSIYWSVRSRDINLIVRHGTTKSIKKNSWYHRLVYNRVNWHVVISKHLLENVNVIFPIGENTGVKVIYPSFAIPQICTVKANESGELKVLHVGRIARPKGQLDALQACKQLIDEGIELKLKFVGGVEDKKYFTEIKDYISQYELDYHVDVIGNVDDVSGYYDDSDAFLFPSHGEGLGNVFCEALAHGLACICYRNTALQEFRELGFHYYMAENLKINSLIDTLRMCLGNLQDERKLLKRNMQIANEVFSTEKEIVLWSQILK